MMGNACLAKANWMWKSERRSEESGPSISSRRRNSVKAIWDEITLRFETADLVAVILAWIVPYGIYKINKWLHRIGDPPWKQEN